MGSKSQSESVLVNNVELFNLSYDTSCEYFHYSSIALALLLFGLAALTSCKFLL